MPANALNRESATTGSQMAAAATRAGWLVAGACAVMIIVAALWQPPDVYTDAGTCLLAAEQFIVGQSPGYHTLVSPRPDDLALNRIEPISWWPPSYEAIPFLFRIAGLNWGRALQATFLLVWTFGVCGWLLYFRQAAEPQILPWLFACFLIFRYSHSNANVYDGGEFLFWSVFPWALLLNLRAIATGVAAGAGPGTWGWLWPVAAGAAAAGLVLVKYSAGVSAFGLAAVWLWLLSRREVTWSKLAFWGSGAAAAAAILVAAGYFHGPNPASTRASWQWAPILWGVGAWTFAVSDLETLAMKLFVHRPQPLLPPVGPFGDGQVTWLSPLTLGLLFLLWFSRGRHTRGGSAADGMRQDADRTVCRSPSVPIGRHTECSESAGDIGHLPIRQIAVVHLVAVSAILVVLMVTGGRIHMDARLLRPAAIAVLPFLLQAFVGAARSPARSPRLIGAAALLLFFALPAFYGASTLAVKTLLRGASAARLTGPMGIRHDLLGTTTSALEFYRAVREAGGERHPVFYLIEEGLAVPLAGERVIVSHAHFRTPDDLREMRYRGRPAGGVILVVPASFDANGKLSAIQASFIDLRHWSVQKLPYAPEWLLVSSE